MTARVQLRGSFVTDHRDQRLRVHWPARPHNAITRLQLNKDLPPGTAKRISDVVARGYFGSWWWRAAVLIATVFTLVVIFLAISPHITRAIGTQAMAGWMGWIMPLAFGLLIGISVWGDIILERMYARRRFANALLDEGHCPCCMYSLNGLPEEHDDCTVCPECGAAWQVESNRSDAETTPHPPSP